jgi:hypothetical protein
MKDRGNKKRTSIRSAFAPRRIEMLNAPAYCVLSLSARRVLDRIEIELANHGGRDNGKLPVTFDDFVRYGLDRHAIAPAIREAAALGFVNAITGRAGNGEFRNPNLFGLTYRHIIANTIAEPTDEWNRIKTREDAERIAQQARNARKIRPARKQNARGGKHTSPVGKTPTVNGTSPVGGTPTTA